MTWRLTIAAQVDRDIAQIEASLADRASQRTVGRLLARIDAQIELLADNPLAYSERPLFGKRYRLAVVKP